MPRLRAFLRSPRLIVAEVAAVAIAASIASVVPQAGSEEVEAARYSTEQPLLASAAAMLGLDGVYTSRWFLALVALAGVSLTLVLVDQWARLLRVWRLPLGPDAFRGSRYRVELVRPIPSGASAGPRARYRTTGKLGLAGSPILHAGLLLLIVAGLLRMLFARDAVVHLIEGETLPPDPGAYGRQWGGPLSRPFHLDVPIVLDRVLSARYRSGELEQIKARLIVDDHTRRVLELAVNSPVDFGAEALFVTAVHGPAVVVDVPGSDHPVGLALRERDSHGPMESTLTLPGGLELRVQGALDRDGALPRVLDVRVLGGGGAARPLDAG